MAAKKRSSSSSGAAKKRTVVRGHVASKKTNLGSSSNSSVESLVSSTAKENLNELSIAPGSKRSSRLNSQLSKFANGLSLDLSKATHQLLLLQRALFHKMVT